MRPLIPALPELDRRAMDLARSRLDRLAKPPGSLGRLEDLAVQLAGITGRARPRFSRKAVIVMAGDHGVATRGVSAYPQEVTAQMVRAFLAGRAAINVLARLAGAKVVVVDLGVAAELPDQPGLLRRKVGHGTRDLAAGPAMEPAQAEAAVQAGREVVEHEIELGLDLVATGDMGIGNTTASSAIIAALTGRPVAEVTGRGTGLDDDGLRRKIALIERALAVNRPDPADPLQVLARLGGFEIAGLVGVVLGAAARRVPVVLDGLISAAAALVATELSPRARDYLIAGHRSVEAGQHVVLERLELQPLLQLELRLGEGTGAALAMHLVDAAAAVLDEMASLDEAGVSGPLAEPPGEGRWCPQRESNPRSPA